MKRFITVVVPTYEEAGNVSQLSSRVKTALDGVNSEIFFIDDSPTDNTSRAVMAAKKELASDTFGVRMFRRKRRQKTGGLSGAVIDGIKRAESELVLVMDGDLQHPPELIPDMIEKAQEGADMVVASRYVKGGSSNGLSDSVRQLGSWAATELAKWVFPYRLKKITDPMTGYFLIRRQRIDIARLKAKGFKILLEIIARHPKLVSAEVPLNFGERLSGESKMNLNTGKQYLKQLYDLRTSEYINSFRKLPRTVKFGFVGGGVFGIGLAILIALVEIFGMHPISANAVMLLITFALNFLLNKHLTWHDRDISPEASRRFVISRGLTTIFNYYLFAWLVTWQSTIILAGTSYNLSLNYILTSFICLAVVTCMNYLTSDAWVYKDRIETRRKATKPLWFRRARLALSFAAVISAIFVLAGTDNFIPALLAVIGLMLFTQSVFETWRMLYVYREPDSINNMRFPDNPSETIEKFCLLVPARHEEAVIGTTLRELSLQSHPDVTITAIVCSDDPETLKAARLAAKESKRIKVINYRRPKKLKPSKPLQLNYAFEKLKDKGYTVFGVIDAEDNVHKNLLRKVDAAFQEDDIDIVQGGVQLMNHQSRWFTLHNVLEYWRWYRSVMQFQVDTQFTPLPGNTLFIKTRALNKSKGWPQSLTEDCALGVLLSSRHNVKIASFYEPEFATREEAPVTLRDLFFQRVRWVQGFYSEWQKGLWHELPGTKRRIMAGYTLTTPIFLALSSIMVPFSLIAVIMLKSPVGLVLIMYLPLIPLMLQLMINAVYLHDFGREFNKKVRFLDYVNLFVTFFPYQFILNTASFWAVARQVRGNTSWHKTTHAGHHRGKAEETTPALAQEGTTA